ncbi:MAG: SpoIIE family protein phosphatase [Verrucomicrobiota bacterium]
MAANAMERLDLALEASNEGIWDWDFETGTIDYTERVGEFFECGQDEIPNFFMDGDFVHEEDREAFFAALDEVKTGRREVLAAEPRVSCGGGEWKWFRVRGVPVLRSGEVTGLAGSLIDISQRKKAEQALLEQQHLTNTLVDSVPLQIYFKDLKSRFTMVNRSMAKWLGKESPRELIGKTDADFFDAEHAEQALADEEKILESGEGLESVIEKETWSGRDDTWVLTTKMPYRNRSGVLKGVFGVSSDVTDLVRLQRSVAETAAELKRRNVEYEEEMALAREIQQGLLPTDYPAVREAEFGHRYLPISGLAGDFFEVMPVNENAVGLLICDVMGHGVRAALGGCLLGGLLGQATELADRPGAMLGALNVGLRAFLEKAGVTMFATAFYVVVDYAQGEVRYASAGHPAGIVKGELGATLLPLGGRGKGPGLGLLDDAEYGTEVFPMDGVKSVLLFTDGIYEVENSAGEAFLQNRLVKTVGQVAVDADLEVLLDTILGRVKEFASSGGFDDDVCLVGMRL